MTDAGFGHAPGANHGDVTDPELLQRARNAGIVTDYDDWQDNHVEVPAETLAAILDVLDQPPLTGQAVPGGSAAEAGAGQPGAGQAVPGGFAAEARAGQPGPGQAVPGGSAAEAGDRDARPVVPAGRQWGFTVQLYSLRSRQSWGHGDFHDLAELARWSGAELGAGFVLINPLHAAEPLPPVSPSPYLPMTRLFTSPLYLRVEDIPEYAALPARDKAVIGGLAAPLQEANNTPYLIDRDAVWTAKRQALQLISKVPLTGPRQADYDSFRADRAPRLQQWSDWCALAERHGPDWRDWPSELTSPREAAAAVAGDPQLAAAAEFHTWLQWHADQQLAAAQQTARTAGMAHGL